MKVAKLMYKIKVYVRGTGRPGRFLKFIKTSKQHVKGEARYVN